MTIISIISNILNKYRYFDIFKICYDIYVITSNIVRNIKYIKRVDTFRIIYCNRC